MDIPSCGSPLPTYWCLTWIAVLSRMGRQLYVEVESFTFCAVGPYISAWVSVDTAKDLRSHEQ